MAFRKPPPQPYVPPNNNSLINLVILITIIVVIIVGVVLYVGLRRLLIKGCRNDIDCPLDKGKCNTTLGICQECTKSSDCAADQFCSTANTCVS